MDFQNKQIIFYDGYCVLCSRLIRYIIRKDKNEVFWYSSLQSEIAGDILKNQLNIENVPDSIVYLRDGKAYFYSDAAITIFVELGGIFKLVSVFYIIPKFARDYLYKVIAKNRFKIFGRRDTCFIPDEKMRARFLDSK